MYDYELKNTILKIENLSLQLGNNLILNDINVEIKDIVRPNRTTGQIVAFLAPSGMGKTKFIECISGIRKPNTGSVLLSEELEETKIGNVGVVQQNYPLFMNKTIYGNMKVASRHMKKEQREDEINSILEKFDLLSRKNHYPAMLSGGQRQRAAIAQQILTGNTFLMMDEPFSGLDVNIIREVSDILLEVAHEHSHNTIIIISHDIASSISIADTLWIMGRDVDKNGCHIEGAKIKYNFNLIDEGIAWRENPSTLPEFHQMLDNIKKIFPTL